MDAPRLTEAEIMEMHINPQQPALSRLARYLVYLYLVSRLPHARM